jgi:hypothetical protein
MNISSIQPVIEAITGFNECVSFFQWLRSLGSQSNGAENQELKKDDVLKLQNSLQCLRDTLPAMHNFIDRAEWRSHEKCVAELLPKLKAAMYDAEDLLEDFRCYEQKVKIEGSATSAESITEFLHDFVQGTLYKLAHIKERLNNQFKLLKAMGLHQAAPRFDRLVRPETTSFATEAKIFGRDNEIKELIRFLGVLANDRGGVLPDPRGKEVQPVHQQATKLVLALTTMKQQ